MYQYGTSRANPRVPPCWSIRIAKCERSLGSERSSPRYGSMDTKAQSSVWPRIFFISFPVQVKGGMTKQATMNRFVSSALTTLLLGVLALGAGCSRFHRDWRQAARTPAPVSGLDGRWEGVWISDVNGHNGRLRCLIAPERDGVHQARFHAKYRRILSFSYTVPLVARETNGTFHFEGEADLGRLAGGVYRYSGHADGTNFFSTYSSKHDHGVFRMVRLD